MTDSARLSTRTDTAGSVPVAPSAKHTVLCWVPTLGAPAPAPDCWDEWHVRLPCSPKNLYPQPQPDGSTRLVQRWAMVQEALRRDIKSSAALETAIKSYNSRYRDKWDFSALRYFIDDVLAEEEQEHLFSVTLPQLCRLALRLPELLPAPLPLLVRSRNHSVTLSQLQVASLLANAFFCTFPRRNSARRGERPAEYSNYPDINFNRLFAMNGRRPGSVSQRRVEKLKCILHYFHRVLRAEPTGVITFTRRYVPQSKLPDWAAASAPLPAFRCHSDRLIEDQHDALQVDFANKFVGGGVLGDGCVQEEIRFLINPELIVTRLFTEALYATECLIVTGCERFSQFEGYADTFKWTAKANDPSPVDQFGRRTTQIVALDAVHFKHATIQYQESFLQRELNKAYAGFSTDTDDPLPPVATGNWGCGVFNGDPRLKSLLQMMAAALAGREVIYLTFNDDQLRDELLEVHAFLQERNVTVGKLYKALVEYGFLYGSRSGQLGVLPFLRQHLARGSDYGSDTDQESEKQPTVEPESESQPMAEAEPKLKKQGSDMGVEQDPESKPKSAEESCETVEEDPEMTLTSNPDVTSDMDTTLTDGADVQRETAAGVKRVRSTSSETEVAPPEDGASTSATSGNGSGAGASAEQHFARFEMISETSAQRVGTRQSKITSFLRKAAE